MKTYKLLLQRLDLEEEAQDTLIIELDPEEYYLKFRFFYRQGAGLPDDLRGEGSLKWDGCCNFRLDLHICSLAEFNFYERAMRVVYAAGREMPTADFGDEGSTPIEGVRDYTLTEAEIPVITKFSETSL